MLDWPTGFSRRNFLKVGARVLAAFGLSPSIARDLSSAEGCGFPAADVPNKRVLHVIGHSHIDAAWLWPWRDASDIALTTFRSALDRMNETPGFCYSHSSSSHYRWAQSADPGMFAEIRQRVREGRWEVLGGWPVEPDCNIPSTESFARHCLYGKEYCSQSLSVDVRIGFNPDSFGHAAGLPTILKNAGYDYYAFMRPRPIESSRELPPLFWWQGPDGSRVLALRIWSYEGDADQIPAAAKESFAAGFEHGAFFLGVGDHGGAVTKQQIAQLLKMREDPSLPELRWSTLREFFAAVERSPGMAGLPVIAGELQHHARGCYSAHSEGKQLNRRAERSLGEAETISIVANLGSGRPYPGDQYVEAWWKVLFNQFHDVLAGSAILADYQDVRDSVGSACDLAQRSRVEGLEGMAKRVDLSDVKEGAVFAFNPLPWKRKALLEYHTEQDPTGNAPVTHLIAEHGERIPIQWRLPDSLTKFVLRLSAWVDLPACGYKVFQLGHGQAPQPAPYLDFFAVSDSGFGISSLRAPDGKELLVGPVGLVVISDTSDTWGHGISKFREEMGRPTLQSAEIIETGPVTQVTRHRARWNRSEIVLDIAQFAGLDVVELRFVIDWHEREQMLKLEIPTAMTGPTVYAKVPGAAVNRQTNGDEEPYQDWVAVQGQVGGSDYTVGLLNDSTYSYDCLNGLLRTVLIRSAPFARHNPAQVPRDSINAWQDQGRQERRFWLVAGKGPCSVLNLDRRADELQSPAEYVMDSRHGGSEPWEQSFLEVAPESIAVLALKGAEQGNGLILRLQERSGTPSEVKVRSNVWHLDYTTRFAPWEIKTLLVKDIEKSKAYAREVSLLEK
jgi:alpha-mannosidase